MKLDVVLRPVEVDERLLRDRAVVVFDVLRATTTMAAALWAGASAIQIHPNIEDARDAAGKDSTPMLLCGEHRCLKPEGFDLGNSPSEYTSDRCAGRMMRMCTTNGTRALIAAQTAPVLLTGALVNADAVARALKVIGRDVLLLCAGTNGQIAMEDVIGAGAVIDAAHSAAAGLELENDCARMALRLFQQSRDQLRTALSESAGGRNVIGAGLLGDIAFCAQLNRFDLVGKVDRSPLRVSRLEGAI